MLRLDSAPDFVTPGIHRGSRLRACGGEKVAGPRWQSGTGQGWQRDPISGSVVGEREAHRSHRLPRLQGTSFLSHNHLFQVDYKMAYFYISYLFKYFFNIVRIVCKIYLIIYTTDIKSGFFRVCLFVPVNSDDI